MSNYGSQRAFTLSWGNYYATDGQTGGSLVFPVIPNDGIQLGSQTNNQTYDGLNGPLLLLGRRNLKTFTIQSFFPTKSKQYKFLYPGSGVFRRVPAHVTLPGMNNSFGPLSYKTEIIQDGVSIIEQIEQLRSQMIPLRAIYTEGDREIFNMAVALTDLQWGYDQAGDISYSMGFTEYVFPSYDATELGELEDVSDSEATENKECDPSVFQTQEEAESGGSGSSYTRTSEARYVSNDVNMLCRHIVSGMTCLHSVYYYNPSNKKIWPESKSGYTVQISRETLVSIEVWCVLNYADKNYPDKSLAAALPLFLKAPIFDYYPDIYLNQYNDKYTSIWGGFNLQNVVTTVLDQWSDECNNGATVNRTLPKSYGSQWGSAANDADYKNYYNSDKKGIYALVYYFEDVLYDQKLKPWYATAQSWIKSGKAWDYSVAF